MSINQEGDVLIFESTEYYSVWVHNGKVETYPTEWAALERMRVLHKEGITSELIITVTARKRIAGWEFVKSNMGNYTSGNFLL